MDTGSELKRNKLNDKDGDRRSLNDFPDAILKHILSFLTTRTAVQTSVLSKRWKFMWTSLSILDIREEDEIGDFVGERKMFMEFVDRVLNLHTVPRIQKFSLSCEVADDDVSRIKTWITAGVRRDVREIDFSFSAVEEIASPYCLFTCETLQVLKICVSSGVLRLPSEILLPSLKILNLSFVAFKDHHPTNLLFASPALEELIIEYCEWKVHKYELKISAPKLRSLTIVEADETRSLGIELYSNTVMISSPELKIFNYTGAFTKVYRVSCAPSICKAAFHSHSFMRLKDIPVVNFNEVLSSLRLVEDLQLSTTFVKSMSRATLPVFENLITLKINKKPVDLSSEEVGTVLNKCPRLETLTFPKGLSEKCDFDRLSNSKFPFLSTLKNIKIGVFKGNFMESFAVPFLLANATFLETMEIVCTVVNEPARKHMENVLSATARASKSCKLDLFFV